MGFDDHSHIPTAKDLGPLLRRTQTMLRAGLWALRICLYMLNTAYMRRACSIAIVLVFASWGMAEDNAKIASLMPTDAESRRTCFLAIFHAVQVGDEETVQSFADGLRIPDTAQWFNNAFGATEASTMADKYDQSFLRFRSGLIEDFKWADNSNAELSVEALTNPPKGVTASATAPQPHTHVPVYSFKFVLKVPGKGRREWSDSFVTAKGKLRYVGGGTFPFWAGPVSVRVESKTH
jgi:hypothetical protein